ncbi:hypothetical protein [Limnobacter sp.]|uniref:hypothetical protein n=1 Tax=Limnobacter sp. TaxID=2003368 RepID=UPI0027326BCC|nr:hypothetical protein [Limnobacter sp.]MDP3187666.1 hypothetical protein [Limnobacter sp.]
MIKLSCFAVACLYWCSLPAWAGNSGETQALSKESRAHFEQPCPDGKQLGYFDLIVRSSGELVFHSRCIGSSFIESVLLSSDGKLPAHELPRVLEMATSRRGISTTSSVGVLHQKIQLKGDLESPCVQVTATASKENPFPDQFVIKKNWRSQIQYLVDSACTAIAIKAGNWVVTLPADRAEAFRIYGVEFRVEPLSPQSVIADSINVDQRLLSSYNPNDALSLGRKGFVQFFEPCPLQGSLSFSTVRISPENLIFDVRCSFEGRGEWRTVTYPNSLIETDHLLILNSTGTLNITDRGELNVRENVAATAERILLKRMDESECVQIVAESNNTNPYPISLMQEPPDWRESVGYSIDSACRVLAINAGNLIAVMPAKSPEDFLIYGIQFTTIPLIEDLNANP